MDEYCKISGEDRSSIFFMYKGREVLETDTPKSINFVEGDTIEVYDLKAYLLWQFDNIKISKLYFICYIDWNFHIYLFIYKLIKTEFMKCFSFSYKI